MKLRDVADLCLGKMLDAIKNKGRLLPYLRNPNVRWFDVDTTDLRMMPFEEDEDDRYGLRRGDVVICEGGEAGRAAIWDGRIPNLKFQKAIHRVRPTTELDARYLVHRLKADYHSGRLADYYTGTTIKHLTGQDLASYRFPLPPLVEQRRIAEILDKADALQATRRVALGQLDTLTQSIFVDMFGDPQNNAENWSSVRLGDHASKIGSGATPTGGEEVYKTTGIALIRSMNVRDGFFTREGLAFIDEEQGGRLSGVVVQGDDVLLNITGASVARVCRAPRGILPARVNQHVSIIRPSEAFAPAYLEQFLLMPSIKQRLLTIAGAGATREAITKAEIKNLTILLPPRRLPDKFAAATVNVGAMRLLHDRALWESQALFASLQHRAFRGEL